MFGVVNAAYLPGLLIFSAFSELVFAEVQNQTDLAKIAAGLQVKWNVLTNTREDDRFDAEITLENRAENINFTYGPWEIHFNSIFQIEPDIIGVLGNQEAELPCQGFMIGHLRGDHYYLKPNEAFLALPPGVSRKIKLNIGGYSVARSDSMPNWYITYTGLEPVVLTSTQGDDLAFVGARSNVQQWKRFDFDEYNPYTPQERYERNFVPDLSYDVETRVIPKAARITCNLDVNSTNRVTLEAIKESWNVTYEGNLTNEANYLASILGIQAVPGNGNGSKLIHLRIGDVVKTNVSLNSLSSDVYSVTVNARLQRIDVVGQGPSGVFYGAITLRSILDNGFKSPDCAVTDGPRFPYRGLMLDIARNFHSKEEIVNIIKLMATFKLNKLHLHLSDDEGWRIQIPALPELTQFGSRRCHDPQETRCLIPQLGSGPNNSTRFGTGFLTSADYIEILQEAKLNHVTVIPEINLPGHSRAAILSMKLRNSTLNSQGQGANGASTTLVDPDDQSEYTSPGMFSDNVINPCLNSTYNFIGIVMDELILLHNQGQQSLETFHFGGDRVPTGAWVNSSACKGLNPQPDSYRSYFYQRLSSLAASKGLTLAAWEDGLMQNGNKPFNLSTSPVKEIHAYANNGVWETGSLSSAYTLANNGYKVVLSHSSHLYLDQPYEPDPEEAGSYYATRFTDTKKLFSYNANSYYDNALTDISGAPIKAKDLCAPGSVNCPLLSTPGNIVGMEGVLFSTGTRTEEQLHQSLFPRLLALAERAWHKAPWEGLSPGAEQDRQLNDDWSSFVRAVGFRGLVSLERENITFRIPPPGAIISYGRLLTNALYPGLVVEYSYDAGINWQDAPTAMPLDAANYRIWLRTRSADSTRFSRTVTVDTVPQMKITNQPIIDYIAQYMDVKHTVIDNYKTYGDDLFVASIRLTNLGNETVPAGNWRIYFSYVYLIEPSSMDEGRAYVDLVAKITISHVKGYHFSLGPTVDFQGIAPGAFLEFTFTASSWSVSRYDQMPRWYVSAPGMNARNLNHTMGKDLAFVAPFTKPEQWKRFAYDKFDPWTPEVRYDRNIAREVTPLPKIPVIPTPAFYTAAFNAPTINLLQETWTVVYTTESTKSIGEYFIDTMKLFFPNIRLTNQTAQAQRSIRFQIGNVTSNNTEAYNIRVKAQNQTVVVVGPTPDGVFYGATTLIQIALKFNPTGSLPESQIEDWPRLPYRGMHVDTARNFIPKETILKLLKVMSLYKLNKLHFHLTDDEGWRLEIPGLEELTEIGGKRCHSLDETECVMATLGSGADTKSSGSGFYTVDDYKEILRLAQKLHIEVIPEFDSPGHAHAAIRSMKVRQTKLKDLGNVENSGKYVLHDDKDSSYYLSVQYYTDNAVNPCIDSTYRFIEQVYTQVKEMHKDIQPLKVFHFGGDEVAKGAWVNSSACASFRSSSLKSVFTQRVSSITKDVSLGAWEDGLMDHDSIPWERSLLVNKDVIVQTWQNVWEWGVASRAYNLANGGYKVVFSPVTHMYFDHPQEPSPEERGFYWGTRYTDAYKTFSFMPDDYYMNADIKRSGEPITLAEICGADNSGCPPLTKKENIYGLQGQCWAETIRLPENFEYMVFPRLLSLAERAWHKGSWEGNQKQGEREDGLKSDWARFALSLGQYDLGILDKLNVEYRVPPPGAKQVKDTISAKVEFPGLKVQYKVGDSNWGNLTDTQTFKGGLNVALRTVSADGKRFSTEVNLVTVDVPVPPPKSGARVLAVSMFNAMVVSISYFVYLM